METTLEPSADRPVCYREARRRAIAAFERSYVLDLVRSFRGSVADAASAAGVDRRYFYRLLRRARVRAA